MCYDLALFGALEARWRSIEALLPRIFPRLNVFVSSTMVELREEREAVKAKLEESLVDAWTFEDDAEASSKSIQQTYRHKIETADVYVGIFALRYGERTIEEYMAAASKPRHVYIKQLDSGQQRDPRLAHFLQTITAVESGVTPAYFQTAAELAARVKEDIAAFQTETLRTRWNPVRIVPGTVPATDQIALAMLRRKVKQVWIDEVLRRSVHGTALLKIGKEVRPDAVERPWERLLEVPDGEPRTLLSGASTLDVFEQFHGSLLLLGEPGSGKTTTLLELARDLLARAEEHPQAAVPVVLNLSSFHASGTLDQWLVNEIVQNYQVHRELVTSWVRGGQLLPLLDGLDEASPRAQAACVQQVNKHFESFPLPGIVISCRTADYLNLLNRFRLPAAIVLQPLQIDQVRAYLTQAGSESLAMLGSTLEHDVALRELASSPLMLDLLIVTHGEQESVELRREDQERTTSDPRRRLLQAYVSRMLSRTRNRFSLWNERKTIHWLSVLAQELRRRNQTVFFLKDLQPSWIGERWLRRLYFASSRFVAALLISLGLAVGAYLLGYDYLRDWWMHGLVPALVVSYICVRDHARFEEPTTSATGKIETTSRRRVGVAVSTVAIAASAQILLIVGLTRTHSTLFHFWLAPAAYGETTFERFGGALLLLLSCSAPLGLALGSRRDRTVENEVQTSEVLGFSWWAFGKRAFPVVVLTVVVYLIAAALRVPRAHIEVHGAPPIPLYDAKDAYIGTPVFNQSGGRFLTYLPSMAPPATRLWSDSGRLLHTFREPVGFAGSGSHLIVGCRGDAVALYSAIDGHLLRTVQEGCERDPKAGSLFMTSSRGHVVVRSAVDGAVVALVPKDRMTTGPEIDPLGERLVTVESGTLKLWQLRGQRHLTKDTLPDVAVALPDSARTPHEITFLKQGNRLLACDSAGGALLEVPSLRLLAERVPCLQMTVSPDGEYVLGRTTDENGVLSRATNGSVVQSIGRVKQVVFSPRGRLYAISREERLRVWDTHRGTLLREHPDKALEVLMDEHGKTLLLGLADSLGKHRRTELLDADTFRTVLRVRYAEYWMRRGGRYARGIARDGDQRDDNSVTVVIDVLGRKLISQNKSEETLLVTSDASGDRVFIAHVARDERRFAFVVLLTGLLWATFRTIRDRPRVSRVSINEGLWLAMKNAIATGLGVGAMVGSVAFAIAQTIDYVLLVSPQMFALVLAAFATLVQICIYAGFDLLAHYTIRIFLVATGRAPLRYHLLLEHGRRLVLLRKVGGGYMFVHRLILDHLADQADAARVKSPPVHE